jgi:hypothetical protein
MTKVKEAPRKVQFVLPNESVLVRYVKVQTGFITNPNHVAYGGKLEGAIDTLPAKQSRKGGYLNVLTKEEETSLEDIMSVNSGYLSIHKPEDNFWDKISITLTKEGLILDLSNPMEYINYKVLLTYDDYISPSIMETQFKRSYRYEMVRTRDIDAKDKKEINYDIKAYKLFGKMEDSNEQLAGVIRVLSGRSVAATNNDWLVKEVGKLIKTNSKRFVEIVTDPDYETKLFIEKAISKKQIVRNRGKYTSKDGVDLCEDGEVPTLINSIRFLQHIKNQEMKLAIEAGI